MHDDQQRAEHLIAGLRSLRDRSRACTGAIQRRLEDPARLDPRGMTARAMEFDRIYASAETTRVHEAARIRRVLAMHFTALPVVLAACAWLASVVWSIT
jgi:hypothetical protein